MMRSIVLIALQYKYKYLQAVKEIVEETLQISITEVYIYNQI